MNIILAPSYDISALKGWSKRTEYVCTDRKTGWDEGKMEQELNLPLI